MTSTPLSSSSSSLLVLVTMVMVSITTRISGFSTGAPDYVCRNMRPLHPGREKIYSPSTFPFEITLSGGRSGVVPGSLVTVTIRSKRPEDKIQGVLATALDYADHSVSGLSISSGDPFKLLECTRSGSKVPDIGLTHTRKLNTSTTAFGWRVPRDAVEGAVYNIRVTVVQNILTYWVGVNNTLTVGRPLSTTHATRMTSHGTHTTSHGTHTTSHGTHTTSFGTGSSSHMPTSPGAGSGFTGLSRSFRHQVYVVLASLLVSVLTWYKG